MRGLRKFLSGLTVLMLSTSCEQYLDNYFGNSQDTVPIQYEETSYVTSEQAKIVADSFFSRRDVSLQTRSVLVPNDCISSVYAIEECSEPIMYVVNYCQGGFVIVSASRDYLPVLAYSKEGRFDISSVGGGLGLWLDEAKSSVIESGAKPDSVRIKMNRLWDQYDKKTSDQVVTKSSSSMSAAEIACMERCEELYNLYGDDGWQFSSLSGAQYIFEEAGLSDYYDQLCYSANFNHSSPSCSVVGWKIGSFENSYGPILSTHWHQDSPFNDLCDGYAAGCAAVAIAQVMKHYEYPELMSYNGTYFGWNSIPVPPTSSSSQSLLIRAIGVATNMRYWSVGSWTTPGNVEDGLELFGYHVTRQNCNYDGIEHQLLDYHRPVILLGNNNNLDVLPGSLAYVGNSHYWVADGARHVDDNVVQVFAEWQPYDSGSFTNSYYSIDDPDVLGGTSYLYYHYNWGWGNGYDGWYAFNSNDYSYSRQSFYISAP